jgi:hypothetical protein
LPDDVTEEGEANKLMATPQAIKAIKITNIILVFFSILLPKNYI